MKKRIQGKLTKKLIIEYKIPSFDPGTMTRHVDAKEGFYYFTP